MEGVSVNVSLALSFILLRTYYTANTILWTSNLLIYSCCAQYLMILPLYTNILSCPGKDIPSAAHVRKSILHGAADHVLRKVWICCKFLNMALLILSPCLNHQLFLFFNKDCYIFYQIECTAKLCLQKTEEKDERKYTPLIVYITILFFSLRFNLIVCLSRFCFGPKRKIKWKNWRHA
jgi:hypothetical protein